MYRTPQEPEPLRRLDTALAVLDAHTTRMGASFDVATLGLAEIQSRLSAWNDRHGLNRRVLVLDAEAGTRTHLQQELERELCVQVDTTSSVAEAGRTWSMYRHGVMLVAVGRDTASVEFVRATGRGPRVILMAENHSACNDKNLQRTARNLDAALHAKPLSDAAAIVGPLLDPFTPHNDEAT